MPEFVTSIDAVAGFMAKGVHAGLKTNGKRDMTLVVSDRDCAAGAVFTRNLLKAAPVLVNQEHLARAADRIRAVAVNTVSANAGTGEIGLNNSRRMAELTAGLIGCDSQQVFVMSTGVIGTHLPMHKIQHGLEIAYDGLGDCWQEASEGIMTTDAHPKIASIKVTTSQGICTIGGLTKGAGMIAPNMATMLGIIVTDALLNPEQAQTTLSTAAEVSYNRIVVDGDTSTNDMVVLLANGASGVAISNDADLRQFQEALDELTTYLAQQVVRDGEGATKFVTIDVRGASSNAAANQIAHTIAASPLVKTAFYGNDANWGRIMAAAGRAGIDFDVATTSLCLSPGLQFDSEDAILLFDKGMKASYNEEEATAIISADNVYATLDLGGGDGQAIVWTCDLSHEYVSINADYRS